MKILFNTACVFALASAAFVLWLFVVSVEAELMIGFGAEKGTAWCVSVMTNFSVAFFATIFTLDRQVRKQ